MSSLSRLLFLFVLSIAASAQAAVTTSVEDIPAPSGTQRFLYVRPEAPRAIVVVLSGGDGVLGIQNDGTMNTVTALCGPITRNRQIYADHGYALALVDKTSNGSVWAFADV